MLIICPRCRKRHSVMSKTGDFICDCQDLETVRANNSEDVFDIGKWEDYTGSGGQITNFLKGSVNKLQGTTSAIEDNANFDGVTKLGNRKSTHRTRAHLEYIEVKE